MAGENPLATDGGSADARRLLPIALKAGVAVALGYGFALVARGVLP